jgi:hypothetical protein
VTTVTTGVAGTARITPEGVYGSIAVAVVCVAWKGECIGQLALPALAVIGLGAVLDLSPERVADLALVATLLNLLAWQLAALRQGPRPGVVTALATVVLGVVIGLRLLVK